MLTQLPRPPLRARFMRQLLRHTDGNLHSISTICEGTKARSPDMSGEQRSCSEVFYLPPVSLEVNPDESLSNGKPGSAKRKPARTKSGLLELE
jgi:hypothetical protein